MESLVERARGGDLDAFEQIVRRFQDMACGYAYSILGDFQLAEDAAQEAFVEAHAKLGDLRRPEAFPGWFRRIVFKHCDRLTRGARVPTRSLEAGEEPAAQGTREGEGESELKDRILAAVEALPHAERLVTTLYYINGYSQKEVAGFVEEPLGTVKYRLHKAREQLKGTVMTMVADVLKDNAPDAEFARRVQEAIEVFQAKGSHDGSGSHEYWHGRGRKLRELSRDDEEAFRLIVELSKSDKARVREQAAFYFGLRGEPRGKEHLRRLMKDVNARVRKRAVRGFARLIHPLGLDCAWGWGLERRADRLQAGVRELVPLTEDCAADVRIEALLALAAYVGLGSDEIAGALRTALDDPKHKVRHYAARVLGVVCPGCGERPQKEESAP